MAKRNYPLYWKFSELSFDTADQLWDAYIKLRHYGHNPVIRQTDEKIFSKFLTTISVRRLPLSPLAKQSIESFKKTGKGIGESKYYVLGSKISYKLVGSDWDESVDDGFYTYAEALKERNKYMAERRWIEETNKKEKGLDWRQDVNQSEKK